MPSTLDRPIPRPLSLRPYVWRSGAKPGSANGCLRTVAADRALARRADRASACNTSSPPPVPPSGRRAGTETAHFLAGHSAVERIPTIERLPADAFLPPSWRVRVAANCSGVWRFFLIILSSPVDNLAQGALTGDTLAGGGRSGSHPCLHLFIFWP